FTFLIEQDIPGLDIAMKNPVLVSVMNSTSDFGNSVSGAFNAHSLTLDQFIKLASFHELHAEVAGAIVLADFVDGNNTGMLQTGSSVLFASKAIQMRFSRPMAKGDHFQCDRAIKTFLPGTIDDTLTTAADLVEQFVIAEVGQRLCRTRSLLNLGRSSGIADIFSGAAVIVRDYRCACEKIEAGLEEACGAKSFRCVGKNLRSALSTNSQYAAHRGRVPALSILYCAEFYHTLRSQRSDQMAQLIFDIAGNGNSVADFLSQ